MQRNTPDGAKNKSLMSSSLFSSPHHYIIGMAAALGVVGFYLGLITLTSDWYNARIQFSEYRWWILALSFGLGVQATLYSLLKMNLQGRSMKAAKSSLAASGGMSTASMAACCAHYYLAVFLPALLNAEGFSKRFLCSAKMVNPKLAQKRENPTALGRL